MTLSTKDRPVSAWSLGLVQILSVYPNFLFRVAIEGTVNELQKFQAHILILTHIAPGVLCWVRLRVRVRGRVCCTAPRIRFDICWRLTVHIVGRTARLAVAVRVRVRVSVSVKVKVRQG